MKESIQFFRCPTCGRIIEVFEGEEKSLECCGEKMVELIANTTDAATEKHVPVCKKQGEKVVVTVGEVAHPMEEEHSIQWIAQVYDKTINKVNLTPKDTPQATFKNVENATFYAYCNKHGLWKSNEVK